jgi:copper resistance protein B
MRLAVVLALSTLPMPGAGWAQDHDAHHGSPGSADDEGASRATSPAAPTDHAADAFYDTVEMEKARAALRYEGGGMGASKIMVDRLEWKPGKGSDGYAWEVEGWVGGDLDRFAFKTKGEGELRGPVESFEVQAGWSHALDPWFNMRAGIRQDIRPRPTRTHAVLGIEGLAPYWFEVEGELFLSQKGEITARAEASYDQRITQRLIIQPAAEMNFSAQEIKELETGAGFTSVELGLRLRYEVVREFAPYVGFNWDRKLGATARFARAHGEAVESLRFVTGVRLWF